MGATRYFVKSMASANSVVTFDVTKGWAKAYLLIPTMPSSTSLDVYAGVSDSAVYQVRRDGTSNTLVTFIVAATAAANGGMVPLPGGFQYYKLQATDSSPTSAIGFTIVCSDN